MAESVHRLQEQALQAALAYLQQGRLHEAVATYLKIIEQDPNNAEAHFNLAITLNLLGRHDEAISSYQKVISLRPDVAEAHNNLGTVLQAQGKLSDAVNCYKKSLALKPNNAEAHNNLGNAYKDQGNLFDALVCYQKALSLKPDNPGMYSNQGEAYRGLKRLDEALACFKKAFALKPDLREAQWNLGLTLCLLGDLAAGLPLLEIRFEFERGQELAKAGIGDALAKVSGKPRWQGENLQGKTLVVWTEQGTGDSIMMLRYLPLLKERGVAAVWIYCAPELARVMETVADRVISNKTDLASHRFDYHCSIMSLPYLFGTRLETIPNKVPYLLVPGKMTEKWAKRLAAVKRLKVGLVWAGNRRLQKDFLRSVPLKRFAPLMELSGVQFISLQKGEESRQLFETDWRIFDWMDDCHDFLDTAALVQNLDLVISVDTSVAHLAGALGKPVWLLNRFESEWRWMIDRNDSPWYPSMRIFRQTNLHDWDSVLERVTTELDNLVPESARGLGPMTDELWREHVKDVNTISDSHRKGGFFARFFGSGSRE